jgi:hypothetical protein
MKSKNLSWVGQCSWWWLPCRWYIVKICNDKFDNVTKVLQETIRKKRLVRKEVYLCWSTITRMTTITNTRCYTIKPCSKKHGDIAWKLMQNKKKKHDEQKQKPLTWWPLWWPPRQCQHFATKDYNRKFNNVTKTSTRSQKKKRW